MHLRLALLALFISAAACAQTALSLAPSTFHTTPTAPIFLTLLDPTAKPTPWPTDLHWFFIRCAGTQENHSADNAPKADAAHAIPLDLPTPGVALIGLDIAPRITTWSPETFAAFTNQSAQATLCIEAPTLVEHLISAATLIRINTPTGELTPDSTATSKSGQNVEIRPLMDPTTIALNSTLAFRLYLLGDAVPNATLTAHHPASNTTRSITADAKAIGNITIDHPGLWRLEFHTITPLTEGASTFRAGSASLTFEAPSPPPPKPATSPEVAR